MYGQQEELFDSGKQKAQVSNIADDVKFKAGEVRDILKACDGYNKLLKDGPKTAADIYFRCQQGHLASDHLKLLSEQAAELSKKFSRAAATLDDISNLEEERLRLCTQYGIDPHSGHQEDPRPPEIVMDQVEPGVYDAAKQPGDSDDRTLLYLVTDHGVCREFLDAASESLGTLKDGVYANLNGPI